MTSIGLGKSSVDRFAETAAAYQGRTVQPDAFPDRGHFYRSDQFSFARIGVPALYLNHGVDFPGKPAEWGRQQEEQWEAQHYHQPSDQLEPSWNFDGMVQDAQLGFFAGWLIAQADSMPQWNKGDEFEAARKQALAQIEH